MDVGALVGGAVALVVGLLSWTQSRATNRRSDFKEITDQLRKDLDSERTQRKLLTSYVVDLWRWAKRVGPDTRPFPLPGPRRNSTSHPGATDRGPALRHRDGERGRFRASLVSTLAT